jgi:hypothetical protein
VNVKELLRASQMTHEALLGGKELVVLRPIVDETPETGDEHGLR